MSQFRAFVGRLNDKLTIPIKQTIVRSLAAGLNTRTLLNYYYNALGYDAKSSFYSRYAKIFRQGGPCLMAGEWRIDFLGETIRLPLRPECSWLDWDAAISLLGHDTEIKTTYARLITSSERPEVFLDVGANYGTHSILFSLVGVPSIAFEPNPQCLEYCGIACDLNHLQIEWEPVAVGDRDGEVELVFPERETWLGSVSRTISEELLTKFYNVVVERVKIKKLDHYASQLSGKKVLLKIDVEGAEASVLRGASTILKQIKPTIIFESFDRQTRYDLLSLLTEYQYVVMSLPWIGTATSATLTKDEFFTSRATNFLAKYDGGIEK